MRSSATFDAAAGGTLSTEGTAMPEDVGVLAGAALAGKLDRMLDVAADSAEAPGEE
jgi:hypothetical protein